jgi:hypothetical protein
MIDPEPNATCPGLASHYCAALPAVDHPKHARIGHFMTSGEPLQTRIRRTMDQNPRREPEASWRG